MLHSDKKREKESGSREYTHPKIQKGKTMRTVLFAYYLNSERKHEALYAKQSLDFMRSYKMGRKRKTVSEIEEDLT